MHLHIGYGMKLATQLLTVLEPLESLSNMIVDNLIQMTARGMLGHVVSEGMGVMSY